jgi:hypothetical protein
MLNAGGGEIWVGIREEGSRATDVEGIPNPQQEWRSLRAYLADTIEPFPVEGEISVDPQNWEQATVLRLKIQPSGRRGPYAYLQNGGRYFVTRQGSHNRWMDREEIFGRPREVRPDTLAAVMAVSAEVKHTQEALQEGEDLFWLRLQPTRDLRLNLEEIEESDLLLDPTASGNRRAGFVSFASVAGFGPRVVRTTSGKAHLEVGRRENTWLKVFEDGGVLFTAPLVDFWSPPRRRDDPERLLWPYAVLEYPISVFRIASTLYGATGDSRMEDKAAVAVVVHLAVFGLSGWTLRPGSPRRWTLRPPAANPYTEGEDFVLERPLVFAAEELEQPDLCGFRLIQRLYGAYGFSRSQIPEEFDQRVGRLVLPE